MILVLPAPFWLHIIVYIFKKECVARRGEHFKKHNPDYVKSCSKLAIGEVVWLSNDSLLFGEKGVEADKYQNECRDMTVIKNDIDILGIQFPSEPKLNFVAGITYCK